MKNQPSNSAWFSKLFGTYSEWLLKRNFHSMRVLGKPNLDQFSGLPLVIYGNHPSWWDPIVVLTVWRRLLSNRVSYTPIDAEMLEKYAFFKKLGYFGVDKHSISGVRSFLRTATSLLSREDTVLFITPQGRFADVRERRLHFESGLSHVAAKCRDAVYLPMAVEFTYWEEKRPEILMRFGDPVFPLENQKPAEIGVELEAGLSHAMRRLTTASVERDSEAFYNLLRGGEGTNLIYDSWRWAKSLATGRTFHAAHGTK